MLAEHLQDPCPLFTSIALHLAPDGVFFGDRLEFAQHDHTFEFNNEVSP